MRPATLLGVVELRGATSSVTLARAYTRGLLLAAGYRELDDVELLVGELVANAIKHSESGRKPDGMVRLRVYADTDTVHVDVTDEGSPGPLPQIPAQADPLSESGRGLWLVREMSTSWGWTQDAATRTVWFEIKCH
ncbi:ATP-binding protein [Sphaerisporangium sp. TRM90804]|uniref:ATP-binding protein n=1 Tax=Sphaerisporangium sp. TRM90804 TaxID=3031113 RepID=UPI00244A0988|nr:ATP-binding protein [Sphaerisporangium sp. TRM90804]MDH2428589.1 ATP-binding protein [Sphaerisporangium sp. TRM90804]